MITASYKPGFLVRFSITIWVSCLLVSSWADEEDLTMERRTVFVPKKFRHNNGGAAFNRFTGEPYKRSMPESEGGDDVKRGDDWHTWDLGPMNFVH